MGTRHVIAVVQDNAYKVAQYGQWDGYPSGQGLDVLAFLQKEDLALFAEKIGEVSFLTDQELQDRWVECGAKPDDQFVTTDISDLFAKKYPENSRNTGADLLKIIQQADRPIKVTNSIDFAGDSLFCEWGYVIDLDKQTFEVYEGFNKEPLDESERFVSFQREGSDYTPIRLVASYALNDLPTKKAFLEQLEKEEDED